MVFGLPYPVSKKIGGGIIRGRTWHGAQFGARADDLGLLRESDQRHARRRRQSGGLSLHEPREVRASAPRLTPGDIAPEESLRAGHRRIFRPRPKRPREQHRQCDRRRRARQEQGPICEASPPAAFAHRRGQEADRRQFAPLETFGADEMHQHRQSHGTDREKPLGFTKFTRRRG